MDGYSESLEHKARVGANLIFLRALTVMKKKNGLKMHVVTPKDRSFRRLSCFSEFRRVSCWFVAFIIASFALHHVIMQPFLQKLN